MSMPGEKFFRNVVVGGCLVFLASVVTLMAIAFSSYGCVGDAGCTTEQVGWKVSVSRAATVTMYASVVVTAAAFVGMLWRQKKRP